MICPKCGSDAGASGTCPDCGTDLAKIAVEGLPQDLFDDAPADAESDPAAPRKRSRKQILICVICILVGFAVVVAIIGSIRFHPTSRYFKQNTDLSRQTALVDDSAGNEN